MLSSAPDPVENPADIVWNFQKDGLYYRIEAAPDLNLEGDTPLGLTICVYQLKDFSEFMSVASSSVGIDTLLDGGLEIAEVRSSRVYRIQPGATIEVTADRMESVRYLAVVAGYAHLRPDLCVAVIPFPIHEDTEGLVFKNKLYSAGSMQALIRLGAESVTISGVECVR